MGQGGYSRFVWLAKLLLPVTALALLSLLFLLARRPGEPGAIPYAKIEEIARAQRLAAPHMSGMTEDGAQVVVSARSMVPTATGASAERPHVRMQTAAGVVVEAHSGTGVFDQSSRHLHLSDLVRIDTSDGYQIETAELRADLARGRMETQGDLEVRAPFGVLRAGNMVFDAAKGDLGNTVVFGGGVHLLYDPQDTKGLSE